MEENGFHSLENEFPVARIRGLPAFKIWFLLISATVLASRKELSSKVGGFH